MIDSSVPTPDDLSGLGLASVAAAGTYVSIWTWSRRARYYLDVNTTITPDDISYFENEGGGTWVRDSKPDVYHQSVTETWLDGTSGDNDNTGTWGGLNTPFANAIKSVGEFAYRINGGTTDVTLYTAAALSTDEAALFEKVVSSAQRQIRHINAALPATPLLDYDTRNINGLNNAGLVTGQSLAGVTWKNLGSAGAAGDLTASGAPIYRAVASGSKLRGGPAIEFDGNDYFESPTISALSGVGPLLFCAVASPDTTTGHQAVVDGNDSANCHLLYSLDGAWALYAGAGTGGIYGTATAGLFHSLVVKWTTGEVAVRTNGIPNELAANAGSQTPDGIRIGFDGFSSSKPFDGKIARVMVFANSDLSDLTALDAHLEAAYGAVWPQ